MALSSYYEKEASCLCVYSVFVLVVKTINLFIVKCSLDGIVAISQYIWLFQKYINIPQNV